MIAGEHYAASSNANLPIYPPRVGRDHKQNYKRLKQI